MKLNGLQTAVENWGKERKLDSAEPTKQYLKVAEENGEIASALARHDKGALKDAIGDTAVTLIILAMQCGTSLEECLNVAYDEIADRKGKMIDGVFVKEADLK